MASKLISMKLDATDRRADAYATPADVSSPAYPYGLEIRLDTSALEKLGLADKLPKVGETLTLTASVDVTGASENERAGTEDRDCSITLQITDLALSAKLAKKGDAEVLYGSK